MRALLSSERGGIMPLTLFLATAIILAGAFAINNVRAEQKRSVMQSVLDICTLNAASQRQSVAPDVVFYDCLDKHRFEGTITSFRAVTGRRKSVTATAEATMDAFFLQDRETFTLVAASEAAEERTNLEIVLALDVSASLLTTTANGLLPINELKAAANQFVETMLAEDTGANIKITLVPYNSAVNLGADLAGRFNLNGGPGNLMNGTTRIGPDVTQMRCPLLPGSVYNRLDLSPTEPLGMHPFVDMLGGTRQIITHLAYTDANFAAATLQENLCSFFRLAPSPATDNVVRLPDQVYPDGAGVVPPVPTTPQERIALLQGRISGLRTTGETSINQGMRWALAFLDPAMRPVFDAYRSANRMPETTAGFPMDYTDPSAIKVVVLMSDGTNRSESRMRPEYLAGPSPFWMGNDGNISWHNPARVGNQYWVPHLPAPTGSPAGTGAGQWRAVPWQNATNTGAPARRMDYTEVWRRMKLTYVAWHFHARSLTQVPTTNTAANTTRVNAYIAALAEYMPPEIGISASTKDTELQTACNLARARGIYVYTILFNTGTTTSETLRTCARSESFAYPATPEDIAAAFSQIALHISTLQLTE